MLGHELHVLPAVLAPLIPGGAQPQGPSPPVAELKLIKRFHYDSALPREEGIIN